MKEITTLEGEIINLERYLLSLYRAAFEQHLPSLSENCGIPLQKNIETESRTIADQSCLSQEPNLCNGNPDYHNPTSPAHGLAGSDDQNHATTPRLSSKRVSIPNELIVLITDRLFTWFNISPYSYVLFSRLMSLSCYAFPED